jgi:hypothetical protein
MMDYKQYSMSFRRSGEMAFMFFMLDRAILTIADLLASPLTKYNSLAANDCRYDGTAEELIVTHMSTH